MITEKQQTTANTLKLDGVHMIYVVLPSEAKGIDLDAKESRLFEIINNLGFEATSRRRILHNRFHLNSKSIAMDQVIHNLILACDAVMFTDEWTFDIECRIEAMLAMYCEKPLLNEHFDMPESFKHINMKFQFDL